MNPSPELPPKTSVVRGTAITGSLNLLSRILGFVREALVARILGAGLASDAFFVAFRIPNLLRSFVAEGALTSAFVPVFATELKKGKTAAQHALSVVCGLLLSVTITLSILGVFFSQDIVNLFAPGFGSGSDKGLLCTDLTRVMFPYIIFVSLVAMLNAVLNSVAIFGAASFAQVLMNIVLIAGALFAWMFSHEQAAMVLAWSVLIGGLIQVLSQLPALRRSGFHMIPSFALWTPLTGQVLRLMLPAILGASVYQISIFLNTLLASSLEQGSVSWLSYADRLTQLPIGIFSIALASVLLPTLSRAKADGDEILFTKNLVNSLRYTSFVLIPVSAGLFVLAEPLVTLVFQGKAFSPFDTAKTALAVRLQCLGLWAVSCHSMLVRGFIARKDTRTPTIVGFLVMICGLVFSLLLMGPSQSTHGSWVFEQVASLQSALTSIFPSAALGHAGLALSSSLSSFISLILIAVLISVSSKELSWDQFVSSTFRTLIATGFMFAGMELGLDLFSHVALQLVSASVIGLIVFSASAHILKLNEFHETFAQFRRILVRKRPFQRS